MANPWITEKLALQVLQEGGRSLLSPATFEGDSTSSGASMMGLVANMKPSKQGHRKLPTRFLVAMTCGIGGSQVLWSTIFSHGSSYLFSLGISTTQSSLIWAAAPICGSSIQPIVGIISDRSCTSWGRRRPFIFGGVVFTVFAVTTLAWAEPISTALCALFEMDEVGGTRETFTRLVAILAIILLNVSIQPLQLGLRSLSIDACPREQQSMASAWASRFAGLGNIVGYILGTLPLPWISSDHETFRFRYMAHCTIFALVTTSSITCYYIEEDDPKISSYEPDVQRRLYQIFQDVIDAFAQTSQRVRRVYLVQFFSWLGWFGFLFYITSFIGQLYVDEQARNNVAISPSLKDHGMRIGAKASLLFAIVALATNIMLPTMSRILESMIATTTIYEKKKHHCSSKLHIIWGFGQLAYVMSVLSTTMVSSSTTGTLVIAVAGFSWGVTQWVPFSIVGEGIARRRLDDDYDQREDEGSWNVVQGGGVMGLHNAAISVPQIIAALVSSGIFYITHQLGEDNAIRWVIGWTGVPGAVAAWLAFTM